MKRGPQGVMPRVGRQKAGIPAFAGDKGGSSTTACPFCSGGPVSVIDSRRAVGHDHVRRARVCRACKTRWTTYEITDAEMLELVELRKFKATVVALLAPMVEAKADDA